VGRPTRTADDARTVAERRTPAARRGAALGGAPHLGLIRL